MVRVQTPPLLTQQVALKLLFISLLAFCFVVVIVVVVVVFCGEPPLGESEYIVHEGVPPENHVLRRASNSK